VKFTCAHLAEQCGVAGAPMRDLDSLESA